MTKLIKQKDRCVFAEIIKNMDEDSCNEMKEKMFAKIFNSENHTSSNVEIYEAPFTLAQPSKISFD